MPDLSPTPRRPAIVILVLAAAWLVAAAMTAARASEAGASLVDLAPDLVVRLAPPLVLAVAALAWLARPRGDALAELEARTAAAGAASAAVRETLLDIDATLAAIGSRLTTLRDAGTREGTRLIATAQAIEAATAALTAAGGATTAAGAGLTALLPDATRHAEALATSLTASSGETARQLGEVETLLAGVATRHDEIRAQVVDLGATATTTLAGIDAAAATLGAHVDAALAGTTAALAATRDGVDAHARTLVTSVEAARAGLAAIGGETAATVAGRIDQIVAATDALAARLDAHDGRTAAMVAAVERSFGVLDKRMGHAAAMGTATLDGFEARLAAVRDAADAVNPRFAVAQATLEAAAGAVARLHDHAPALTGLAADLARAGPPATALAADLAAARATLAAIEDNAHGSALAATSQLIDVLGRVRDLAATSAGTLRDTLAGVVAEAETALTAAGARTAASAFADPIRAEIAGLEGAASLAGDAVQKTADRLAARLLGLTATVATVEARLAEVDRR